MNGWANTGREGSSGEAAASRVASVAAACALAASLLFWAASPAGAQIPPAPAALDALVELTPEEAARVETLSDFRRALRSRLGVNANIEGSLSLRDPLRLAPGERSLRALLDEACRELGAEWRFDGGELTLASAANPVPAASPAPAPPAEAPLEAPPVSEPESAGDFSAEPEAAELVEAINESEPPAPARTASPRPGASPSSDRQPSRPAFAVNSRAADSSLATNSLGGALASLSASNPSSGDGGGSNPQGDPKPKEDEPREPTKPPLVIPVIVPVAQQFYDMLQPISISFAGMIQAVATPPRLLGDAALTQTPHTQPPSIVEPELAPNNLDFGDETFPAAAPRYVVAVATGLPERTNAAACVEALELAGFLAPRPVPLDGNPASGNWAVLLAAPEADSDDALAPLRDALARAGFPASAVVDARLLALQ